jgi:hypothetical protein
MNRNLIISSDDKFTVSKVIINEYKLDHNYDLINAKPIIRTSKYLVSKKDINEPNNIGSQYFVKISFFKSDVCNVITFKLLDENDNIINIENIGGNYINNFYVNNECIIRETEHYNFYYKIKNGELYPYFNVVQHASEVKFTLNKIKNILTKVKSIIFEMATYNFPIMQMYAINPNPPNNLYRVPCNRYNVLFSVSGNLYPKLPAGTTQNIINSLNEYIYENFPICVFPKYSSNTNKLTDNITGDERYFNININDDENILYGHSQFYFSIQKLINILKELKNYTKLGLFNETIDEDISMFNKYLVPKEINIVLKNILRLSKATFDDPVTQLTTAINDIGDNKYYVVEYYNEGNVKFIVNPKNSFGADVFTFEKLHNLVKNVKDDAKLINLFLNKIKESIYLLNNITDNGKLADKNFILTTDENIKKISKTNINGVNYYAYCFYIFKNMSKYPLLSFKKSFNVNESLVRLSKYNKLKLITMLLMALEGLLVLHKDREYKLEDGANNNKIINSSYFKDNHEINLMEQINSLILLHKLVKIGYHGSIIGKHNIYNQQLKLTNEKDVTKTDILSIHQLLQRNYMTNKNDYYFDILKKKDDTPIIIDQLNDKLGTQDNLNEIILELLLVYNNFNISDVIEKRIAEYKIDYNYETPALLLN